ncbi:MAG TPA: tetratricopeptide repeat protein [Longimicrobium sp.]|nr:tetratricopeptide repeat protein [Longimicrobium sp.]
MRRPIITLALAASSLAAPLSAQPDGLSLGRGADPNDWESWFTLGDRLFQRQPRQAQAAFEWAARLDPTRAEPLLGRWATFYAQDQGSWIALLQEDEEIRRRPQVISNELLYHRAHVRNPFVHRGLEMALYAMLGRRLWWDDGTAAFMNYGEGDFREAAQIFGRMVRRDPERNLRFRHYRALSWVGAGQVDSAIVELQTLLTALRRRDQQRVAYVYEAKSVWEHGLGLLYEARGDSGQARQAFQRALEEDLAWYPAWMGLARLSLQAGLPAEAVEHLSHAVEIAPDDAVVRYEYGNALYAAGRLEEAAAEFRSALDLEPFWADVPLRLGLAYDNLGQPQRAIPMYRAYLQRAPRRHAQTIERVRQRLAALEPGG